MKLKLPKKYNNKIVEAIAEFNLIEDGDKILVGLSGGKDSTFLLYALRVLQDNLGLDFELAALTVDLGFSGSDLTPLKKFCDELDVPFYIEKTGISEYILNTDGENPCAKCALFRKGAIADFMSRHGYLKIAFGHHYDDAVETFLMSILYSGQLLTLQPKRYLSRSKIYIIRPLIYLREASIRNANKFYDFSPIPSPCPYDGYTKREEIKQQLKPFFREKQIFYNVVAAMREDVSLDLWPEKPPMQELGKKMHHLWKKE